MNTLATDTVGTTGPIDTFFDHAAGPVEPAATRGPAFRGLRAGDGGFRPPVKQLGREPA